MRHLVFVLTIFIFSIAYASNLSQFFSSAGGTTTTPFSNLTYGASVNVDASSSAAFSLTMTGNATLNNPSNQANGKTYLIKVVQDGTGNRNLTWGSNYLFGNVSRYPVSQANAVTVFTFISDGTNMIATNQTNTYICGGSSQVISYTGGPQTFTAQTNCPITIKAWGAGGSGGLASTINKYVGGAGGYATGTLNLSAGQSLNIIVGGGGAATVNVTSYGGGGAGRGDGTWNAGNGGGRTAIVFNGVELLTAGGGGGGGCTDGSNTANGGAGGGTSGVSASGTDNGTGATQAAGGSGGVGAMGTGNPGVQYAGGAGYTTYGAGGGGGYYGGGGGGVHSNFIGGGGGGSSYIGGVNSGSTTAGSGTTPGNNGDPAYQAGVGVGGATSTAGGNGLVVLSW